MTAENMRPVAATNHMFTCSQDDTASVTYVDVKRFQYQTRSNYTITTRKLYIADSQTNNVSQRNHYYCIHWHNYY